MALPANLQSRMVLLRDEVYDVDDLLFLRMWSFHTKWSCLMSIILKNVCEYSCMLRGMLGRSDSPYMQYGRLNRESVGSPEAVRVPLRSAPPTSGIFKI
eukprot:6200643-Pleurochrysis_carterae.AAC.1